MRNSNEEAARIALKVANAVREWQVTDGDKRTMVEVILASSNLADILAAGEKVLSAGKNSIPNNCGCRILYAPRWRGKMQIASIPKQTHWCRVHKSEQEWRALFQ